MISAQCFKNIFENMDMLFCTKTFKELNNKIGEFIKELNE